VFTKPGVIPRLRPCPWIRTNSLSPGGTGQLVSLPRSPAIKGGTHNFQRSCCTRSQRGYTACSRRKAAQNRAACTVSLVSLLHVDRDRLGGNTIRHHDQVTDAQLLIARHIEMRGDEAAKRDGHAAVIVRPAVKNVSGRMVGDAD
jgi:hypothetical protein